MKLQVLQEDLSKALKDAIRFINTRPTLPILGNFLLSAEKTKLKIKATNLEMSISLALGAKVEEEGSVTVPAKFFLELITNLNKGQIDIILVKEELKITANDFQASVAIMQANDFPAIPETINQKESFVLKRENLTKALSKVLFSSSLDETRPTLTGILFIFDAPEATNSSVLTLVSSDGFRLSKKSLNLDQKITINQIIIPRTPLLEIIKIAATDDLLFEFKKSDNQLVIKTGETYLSTRLIDGNFPDFQKIIPVSSTTNVNVDKNDLERGVKLAAVFARSEGNIIKMTVNSEGPFSIQSETAKAGKENYKIEADVSGGNLDISFNYKFIEEFVSIAEGDSVEIKLTDSVSPAIFVDPKDKDFLHIIMPVSIKN